MGQDTTLHYSSYLVLITDNFIQGISLGTDQSWEKLAAWAACWRIIYDILFILEHFDLMPVQISTKYGDLSEKCSEQ